MDESRKLYEEWFKSRYGSLSIPPKQRLVMRTYSWAAWQASRAAIEIELPEPYDDGHGNLWLPQDNTTANIRAAGIKVKE
ncbi:hypothetical protein ACEV60_03075 [Enterobacter ludwigii]|uniref:hypothetical protein n=1 Tax=Enterobacter ludwigii TaxID=299767 RepID=UPI003BEED900